MKILKHVLVLGMMLLLLSVFGCEMSSAQRVKFYEDAIVQAEKISEGLAIRLDEMEAVFTETQTAMSDPNLPAEYREQLNSVLTETIEDIKMVSAKRGEYTGLILRLREQIEKAQTGDMDFGAELQLYGKGLQTIGPKIPPPIGGFVTLAGIIAATIGGMLARKRSSELTDVVGSVGKLLKSNAVPNVDAALAILGGHQLDSTRATVRRVIKKNHIERIENEKVST